jgi:hypothetical protein
MRFLNWLFGLSFALSFVVLLLFASAVNAQTTSFTYQGRLTDGGAPANNNYDLQFTLWDSLTGGTQQPQPAPAALTKAAVDARGGVFSVLLDFGVGAFPGPDRFLEVGLRPGNSGGAFTILAPRQQISSTPYAPRALNATAADSLSSACVGCVTDSQINSVAASKLTGALPPSSLPTDSASYIQNRSTQQASANFNISGDGTAGGTLSGNVVNAAMQYNISGSRVFSVTGGNVTANGVGSVANSNTFGGVDAGASVIPSATTAAGNFNTLFGVKAGMNTAKSAPTAAAPFNGCCNSFFGNLVGLKTTAVLARTPEKQALACTPDVNVFCFWISLI